MHKRMDWRSIKFDWNRARAFLVTAEEGSLSAAARALGLAQPTLGRQVAALEDELGVVLFERVGRGLRLTPTGYDLVRHVRAMGEAATRLSMSAYGQNAAIEGDVSITASDAYAAMLLPPILARLHAAEPRIRIEVIAANEASDLLRREADIAIRNFRPREPDLVARKLRDAKGRLYATLDYLERHGPFRTPQDLRHASIIELDGSGGLQQWFNAQGIGLTAANFPFRCASFPAMWAMVKEGLGLGLIDDRIGDNDPMVRRAVPDFAPFDFPVWLVAHREIHRSRRLRFVFDHLAQALA